MLKFAHYTQIEYIGYFIQYTYTRQVSVPQTTQSCVCCERQTIVMVLNTMHIYQTDMLTEKVVLRFLRIVPSPGHYSQQKKPARPSTAQLAHKSAKTSPSTRQTC